MSGIELPPSIAYGAGLPPSIAYGRAAPSVLMVQGWAAPSILMVHAGLLLVLYMFQGSP